MFNQAKEVKETQLAHAMTTVKSLREQVAKLQKELKEEQSKLAGCRHDAEINVAQAEGAVAGGGGVGGSSGGANEELETLKAALAAEKAQMQKMEEAEEQCEDLVEQVRPPTPSPSLPLLSHPTKNCCPPGFRCEYAAAKPAE